MAQSKQKLYYTVAKLQYQVKSGFIQLLNGVSHRRRSCLQLANAHKFTDSRTLLNHFLTLSFYRKLALKCVSCLNKQYHDIDIDLFVQVQQQYQITLIDSAKQRQQLIYMLIG